MVKDGAGDSGLEAYCPNNRKPPTENGINTERKI
jgi:hypothetical protein